jgi:mRNA-degrading endonuclease YafQ of YafQ-DinJ toxin-antitoxin module
VPDPYENLDFTRDFLEDLISRQFSQRDRDRIVRALRLLDENERHPSLRVHQLSGDQAGVWSASASDELRITFERLPGGRKRLLNCSHHYGD